MTTEPMGGPKDGMPDAAINEEFDKIVSSLPETQKDFEEVTAQLPDVAAAAARRLAAADSGTVGRAAPAQELIDQRDMLRKVHDQYPGQGFNRRYTTPNQKDTTP